MPSFSPIAAFCAPLLVVAGTFGGSPDADKPVDIKEEAVKTLRRPLNPAEVIFLDQTIQGETATYPQSGKDAGKVDEERASKWGEDRKIDAKLITWLCTSPKAIALVTYKGLSIQGARIVGRLDLADSKVSFPITFGDCYVPDEVNFSNADLQSLSLEGSSVGTVNGRSARVKGDILLRDLVRSWKVDLSNAAIGGDLDCGGSLFSNTDNNVKEVIYADYLTVGRNIVMANGFRAEKQVRITGAIVDGDVHCIGATFSNPKGVALNASGMTVKGNAYLQADEAPGGPARPFRIEGTFELSNARISGDLNCGGGEFLMMDGDNPIAIRAHGLNVAGDLRLDGKFQSKGEVDLTVTQVGGSLLCKGGNFSGKPGEKKAGGVTGERGTALDVGSSSVGHDVVFSDGFQAEGVVRMEGLSVGGRLECHRGKFYNEQGAAIEASWINVKGDVQFGEPKDPGQSPTDDPKSPKTKAGKDRVEDEKELEKRQFQAKGTVRLVNARIGNDLICSNGSFSTGREDHLVLEASGAAIEGNAFLCDGFHAEGQVKLNNARIGRYLYIHSNKSCEIQEIHLHSAKAGRLHYAADIWPGQKKLFIDGFTYDLLDDRSISEQKITDPTKKPKTWIDWLKLQEPFSSGPYEQLAGVLARSGESETAKAVLIEKERLNAHKILKDPSHSAWDRVWYGIIGPWISYGYNPLGALWGGLIFIIAGTLFFHRAFEHKLFVPKDSRPDAPEPYFNAFIYSIDLFTPIINLYLRENWVLIRSEVWSWRLFWLRTYWILHIVAGWAITSLSVAGLLGWIRHD